MIDFFIDLFSTCQAWLFEHLVQPVMFAVGLGEFIEDAFEGTEWFMTGAVELLLIYIILRPMEAALPVHKFGNPRARWNDFVYTLVQRLGLFPILLFFTLDPAMDALAGMLRFEGVHPFNLDAMLPDAYPVVGFVLYLVVLDFFEYWYHRGQHQINWWWGLHSLHHSQQDMNLWSDDRNHLLDDLLHDIYLAVIALAIGVPPAQYILLVSLSRALQSLQHANIRVHFGAIGERLLVSPRFHRMHHAIGLGHESHGAGSLGGCNFGVLLPIWDQLFRTARYGPTFESTGVRDQLPRRDAAGNLVPGRDYGSGFWRQQWLGLKRMVEYMRGGSTH